MTASATFTETRLPVFVVKKNGVDRTYSSFSEGPIGLTNPRSLPEFAHVIENDGSGHAYVHYLNTDKRLDEWVSEELIRPATEHEAGATTMGPSSSTTNGVQTRKTEACL